ncbi:MAG TPA: hypothetical protein V6D08_09825 [Candidatus Obscuribacterales bacterium]
MEHAAVRSPTKPEWETSKPGYTAGLWALRRRLTRVELLVATICVIAVVVMLMQLAERLTAGLLVQDTASRFAVIIRHAQGVARDRNAYIRVRIEPAAPDRPGRYVIEEGDTVLERKNFPSGLSASGETTVDPHGVPLAPATFSFRKFGSQVEVEIDAKGLVSIP